jgi:dihydroorotate dehydrogenase
VYSLAKQFLFRLDAEQAHGLGLQAIAAAYRSGMNPLLARKPPPLKTRAFGIEFPNPVGCAAGLDKNGAYVDALLGLGFGFVEIGTTTPRPQAGNPKPRMFRIPEQDAVINRLGFNNDGVDALVRNVERARRNGILGINIGKNRDTPNERAADDYIHCLERVYALADYVTVNISSPNTTGLRDLQEEETLRRFIGELREAQEELGGVHGHRVPMLLKVSPDLSDEELDGMATVLNAARMPSLGDASRRTVRPPAVRALDRRAAQAAASAGRRHSDHRRGRHPERRRCGRQGVRRRVAGAVLHRSGLPGPRTDRRMRELAAPPSRGCGVSGKAGRAAKPVGSNA